MSAELAYSGFEMHYRNFENITYLDVSDPHSLISIYKGFVDINKFHDREINVLSCFLQGTPALEMI